MDMDAVREIYTYKYALQKKANEMENKRERVSEMLLIEISSVLFSKCHFSRARLNQTRIKTNKTSKLIKQIIRRSKRGKKLQEKLS